MSPKEWEEFEENSRKYYEEMTIAELMNEANNLSYALNNPQVFPRLNNTDFDKLNVRLRIVTEAFEARISMIIEKGERNGPQIDR